MTIPATTPADGGLTLDAHEVQFLAARLRRLFAHFHYKLPHWAHTDDKHMIGIAPTCIGAVLANLNRADEQRLARGVLDDLANKGFTDTIATPSPGKAQEPVAWHIGNADGTMNRLGYIYQSLHSAEYHIDSYKGELEASIVPLYASPGKADAERDSRLPEIIAAQDEFEVWCLQNGLKTDRCITSRNGMFPCTYYEDNTEFAWRAWANKPGKADAGEAKDAARYRFLRDSLQASSGGPFVATFTYSCSQWNGESADEIVDTAMVRDK